ncbi:hypothetical protein GCM10023093_29130 [Nemorincola caseinilytica]|uniref:SnoaL-like domain-containing protein n=1 Tax=Nemorincola caseinilytica TaxID=2054315 RepID=A0ABP8NMX3_9BACT
MLTLLFAVMCSMHALAQKGDISPQDAAKVDKAWRAFLGGLQKRDTAQLRSMSLPRIECVPCQDRIQGRLEYRVGLDTFLTHLNSWPPDRWNAIMTRKYWVNTIVTSHTPPGIIDTRKHFLIYELAFVTTEPNVVAPGHEGVSHLFQFIDIDGTLRFYGMATVP